MVVSMMVVGAVSANAAGENFEVVALGDGATGDVGNQFVDINDAMAAAGDNGTIKLIADMEFDGNSGFIFVSSKNSITFDLNGHKITSNQTSGINLSSTLPGYATFTVKDTSSPKKGEIITTVRPDYAGCACISGNTGREIVIESGKFTSDGKALYVEGKGATIKSGTFNGDIYGEAPVEIKGGTINGDVTVTGTGFYFDSSWGSHSDASTATITGGTINGDVTQAAASNAITISGGTINGDVVPAAGSDSVTITGGTFAGDVSAYVDMTDVLWIYTNAQGKVSYLKSSPSAYNNGTYVLQKDITTTSYITPSGTSCKDITIDLNGHTYTSSSTRGYAVLLGRNGTAASPNKFTLKNGTLVYTNASSEFAAVQAQGKYNDIVIDNVTITSAVAGVSVLSENQNVTIKDSSIIVDGADFALATNGSKTKNGTITVENSTLKSTGATAVYLPGDADATFTDCTVEGKTAIYVKSGDVTINGGTYTGTGDRTYTYYGNGCYATGDAIVVDNCGYPGGAPDVNIQDGTFVGGEGHDAVASYVKQDDPTETGNYDRVENIITGGAFSNNATPHVDGGFTTKGNDNYYHVVSYDDAMAKEDDGSHFGIDDNLYANLKLLGAQKKELLGDDYKNTSESGQEGDYNIRFVAVINSDIIAGAEDYGFVVAKAGSNKVTADYAGKFDKLVANWGNGEKTISAKGTFNNVCDNITYGDPDKTSTYKYVTCAINNLDNDTDSVIARFFVKVGGKYYYSNYGIDNGP